MPNRCVVWGCDSTPKPKEGVFLYAIPFFGDERAEAVKRRRTWVKFVDLKRKNFNPRSKKASICSKHFKSEDFTIRFTLLPGHRKPMIPRLKRDEVGVCVFPSIQADAGALDKNETTSGRERKRRKIIKTTMAEYSQKEVLDETPLDETINGTSTALTEAPPSPSAKEEMAEEPLAQEANTSTATDQKSKKKTRKSCWSCSKLQREKKCWRVRWINQRKQLMNAKEQLQSASQRVLELENVLKSLHDKEEQDDSDKHEIIESDGIEEHEDMVEDECPSTSDDDDDDDDGTYITESESEEDEPLTEDEICSPSKIFSMHGKNVRTEPKHIVFLSQLLQLFKFCHSCKADNPLVEARQVGTEVVVSTSCQNPSCPSKENDWHSQPSMKYSSGQRGPAGNFLLSMSILFAGGSASKVFQIFGHMGLGCISIRSFYKHQTNHLFPIIHLHWKQYQSKLLEKVKTLDDDGLIVAGDAHHDSMGHNAKYGAYTILCCNVPQIIHFSLVQRNQAESSNAMEFVGFQNCMDYLLETCGLDITTLISDRHTSISSHMKKVLTQIKHYFDLWHLKKKIRKVLTAVSKEKNCEEIKNWIKPCENHLYWSAMSTHSGDGDLIWAKFESFLSHVINKHSNLANPLFNKCAHREIRNRTWLQKDTTAYDKLVVTLTKKSLMNGIKQASPIEQTSSLEGFHSVVNYFAPKMIAYSYAGMYCRHILAILHFNSNLQREVKKRPDGTEQLRVSYPKFKNGEATVRNVTVAQNFDYVEELFDTFLEATKEEVRDARHELKEMTPIPMNAILDKQPVAEAVKKRDERRSMTVHDVPATAHAPEIQAQAVNLPQVRAVPRCKQCKQPMKGHNKVTNCPRNKKT